MVAQVETRVEGGLGNLVLLLGGVDVRLCRLQEGVVVHHRLACLQQIGRHASLDRCGCFQLIRQAADSTEEVGFGIGQVDLFGVEVVLRQSQTRFGLVQVCVAAYTLAAAHADLIVDALVGLQVVASQGDHLAAHQQIQVYLDGTQRQALGGTEQAVGAGVDHGLGARHFVGSVEAVEQHLPQTQFGIAVVQGFLVVVTQRSGAGAVRALAAIADQQVDGGQIAALGELDVFVRGETAIGGSMDLRVVVQCALDGLRQVHGLYLTAGSRQKHGAPQGVECAHWRFLLTGFLSCRQKNGFFA